MEQKKKILVIEDEAIQVMSLERKLKKLGYEVCAMLSTGEQAIEHVEKEKPDVVITEYSFGR